MNARFRTAPRRPRRGARARHAGGLHERLVRRSTPSPARPKLGTLIPVDERKPAENITGELLDGKGSFALAEHKGDVVC